MKFNYFVWAGLMSIGILMRPPKGEAQNIPERVWQETVANLENVAQIQVPKKILKELEVKAANCPTGGHEEVGLFDARRFDGEGVRLIAIRGGGACNCSPTGNCSFWVYQDLGGRYTRVLRSSMVHQFGFLKLKSHGLPDVVLWSHGSAKESTASLWQFNGVRYLKRCNWEVLFKGDSEDAQVRNNTCEAMKAHEGVGVEKQ